MEIPNTFAAELTAAQTTELTALKNAYTTAYTAQQTADAQALISATAAT